MEPVVPREDLQATLEARRELGAEHEPELVDAFIARIERRLEERMPRQPAQVSDKRVPGGVAVAIVSIVLSIPLVAISVGITGSAWAVVAIAAFLLALNALYWTQSGR